MYVVFGLLVSYNQFKIKEFTYTKNFITDIKKRLSMGCRPKSFLLIQYATY